MFHHRFPTSTENLRNACHPFSTKDVFKHNYVIVHNGVIHNSSELKKVHETLGIKYVSEADGVFNDSEALAYDIARYLEGHTEVISAQGSIAFIAIQRNKKGQAINTYFGRNSGNPLKMKFTKNSLTLSSEGEGELIPENEIHRFDHDTYKMHKTYCRIPTGYYSTSRTGAWQDDDDDFRQIETAMRMIETGEQFNDPSDDADRIQEYKNEILKLCFGDLESSIMLAEAELKGKESRRESLKYAVAIYNDASDEEQLEYYSLVDEIFYIKEVLKELEKEFAGQYPSMGFRPTEHTLPFPYAD